MSRRCSSADSSRSVSPRPVEFRTALDQLDLQLGQPRGRTRLGVARLGLALRELLQARVESRDPRGETPAILLAQLLAQHAVAARLAGLALDRVDLPRDLHDDVVDAQQVGLGRLQLQLGQATLVLVAGDARRIFDHLATILRLGIEHLVDAALLDLGVGLRADMGGAQQVLDVAQSRLLAVDQVIAVAAAKQAPGDRDP